jgi:hypothetical protein
VLLHEKFAYARLGNLKFQPYAGLIHSALMGGTRTDGKELSVDFWATFKGGGNVSENEYNAMGAHMGLWDFGVCFPVNEWEGHVYFQKPFGDGSGMRIWDGQNKDYYLGFLLQTEEKQKISGVSLELIKTDYQSGPGTPDPVEPETGQWWLIEEALIPDVSQFMLEQFGIPTTETQNWTLGDLTCYLEEAWNRGNKFGGRDDYMNNGQYYSGWTYHGRIMGTPLYHTNEQFEKYAPGYDYNNRVKILNNRVNGFHIGLEGYMIPSVFYRFKSTFTMNYGQYGEEYQGRGSWVETEDYFFKGGKKQAYTSLELNWMPPKKKNLAFNVAVGYDFGQLYRSFGGRLGIVYTPNVRFD